MSRYRCADEESLPPWLQDKGSEDEHEAPPSRDEDHDDFDEDEDEEPEFDEDEGDEGEDEDEDEDDHSGDNTCPVVDVEPSGEVEVHEGRRRRSRWTGSPQRQAGYDLPPHGSLPKGHPGASSYTLDPAWNYDDYGAIPHDEFPADASYDYEEETPHPEPPRRGHPDDIYSRCTGNRETPDRAPRTSRD
jgi:hypothetical protein